MARYRNKNLCELCAEIFDRGYYLRARVQGNSMHPVIRDGDVVLVKPAKMSEIKLGDVVCYRSGNIIIAHRFIQKRRENGKIALLIKGDSNLSFDKKVHREQVLGKVVVIEREGQEIGLNKGLNRLKKVFYNRVLLIFSNPSMYPIFKKSKQCVRNLLSVISFILKR